MQDRQQIIRDNLASIQDRIANAADRAHRKPSDVCLVGVTKYVDEQATRDLVEAGCRELGESRPQVLWPKAEALSGLDIRWHQIGHLQRNKLRKTLPLVSLVHSVDSLRLLESINTLQGELDPGNPKCILLEVNTSGDSAKHGFEVSEVKQAVEAAAGCANVKLQGLMCMAGLGTTPAEAVQDFAKLRQLRDDLASEYSGLDFSELSMGMSADFEQAIGEGATLVRIGSVLFQGLR